MLVGERIIVKDLAEDLYDGQVLQKLFGKRRADGCGGSLIAGGWTPYSWLEGVVLSSQWFTCNGIGMCTVWNDRPVEPLDVPSKSVLSE